VAVYTSITKKNLESFLENYDIGTLNNFKGILEGVENTNYKIFTSKDVFILTIFEKRVNSEELPFFIQLQKYLCNKQIKCPKPIADLNNNYVNNIEGKNCVIMSFLEGNKAVNVDTRHCYQVAEELAKMHIHTKEFNLTRKNSLNYLSWRNIFNNCKKINLGSYNDLIDPIEKELNYLENKWPSNLPKGVVHADIFQDNVFFKKMELSGIIDFYFACNDYYAYDLAIFINAWCFDDKLTFDTDKYASILKGYEKERHLTNEEKNNLNILLRGAAMRFLLTRLFDQLNHQVEAYVQPKNPLEYLSILKFHQNNYF
tara:strand:+ start:1210 stop:2151 length:942 start_codon:yes stop_codon:yes gene_type:complete